MANEVIKQSIAVERQGQKISLCLLEETVQAHTLKSSGAKKIGKPLTMNADALEASLPDILKAVRIAKEERASAGKDSSFGKPLQQPKGGPRAVAHNLPGVAARPAPSGTVRKSK